MSPAGQPKKPDVFIVSEARDLCESLNRLLQAAGYATTSFTDKTALLAAFRKGLPMCVCLGDTWTADVEATLLDLTDYPVPAIVITSNGDVPTAVRMMKAGAVDFISGEIAGTGIARQLETALAEIQSRTQSDTRRRNQVGSDGKSLSAREQEILELVSKGASSKQIAKSLGISWRTVDDHRASILRKLGARNVAEAVTISARSTR